MNEKDIKKNGAGGAEHMDIEHQTPESVGAAATAAEGKPLEPEQQVQQEDANTNANNVNGKEEPKKENGTHNNNPHAAPPLGSFRLPNVEPKNLRILVVDSDNDSSNETCNILQDCGYQVVAVKTSKMAFQHLEKDNDKIDIILKEHDPPKSDACRMLRKFWNHKTYRNIPLVITSNRYESSIIQKCLEHGAADYMLKPLRHNEARTLVVRVWTRLVAMQFDPSGGQNQSLTLSAWKKMQQDVHKLQEGTNQNNAEPNGHNPNANNANSPVEHSPELSGMSTQSDADLDGDSHEGSNPNDQNEREKQEGDPDNNNNSDEQPRTHDHIHGGTNDRVGPNTLHLLHDKSNKVGQGQSNGLGKSMLTASAFQAFNSPWTGWNNKRSMEGNGDSNGNGNGNGNSNGKNAASNIIGPQHGNGSNGKSSNGNGSNGHNGNGHESNGASSRRIMPKIQQPQGVVNSKKIKLDHNGHHNNGFASCHSSQHIFQDNMTITPFGPMPSHLAQSVFWGMAAQQEMNYLTAMQYQVPGAQAAFAVAQQQQVGVHPNQQQQEKQNKKGKDNHLVGSDVNNEDPTTVSGKTTSTQTGAMSHKHAGSNGKMNGSTSVSQVEQTSAERRAAALDKFRQKKKTLCFSKKIRYASRKQLAEARPRNKGQFVRCNEKQTTESASASASVSAGSKEANTPTPTEVKE